MNGHQISNRRYYTKHKFGLFLIPLFTLLIADSAISYLFPVLVENTVGSNTLLGIIMACSSVAGICFDILIPRIFQQKSWFKLLTLGIILSTLVPLCVLGGVKLDSIFFFLMASIIWGIYFEFMLFATQDYVATEEKKEFFSRDWGIINSFWGVSTLIGPVIGSYLIIDTNHNLIPSLIFLQLFSLLALTIISKKRNKQENVELVSKTEVAVNFLNDVIQFKKLVRIVFPVMMITTIATTVTSTFWTIGGLTGESIATEDIPEWALLIVFNCSMLLSTMTLSVLQIKKHKKKIALITLLCAGVIFANAALIKNPYALLLMGGVGGYLIGFTMSLNDAVFSDLEKRNHITEMKIISLSRISMSFSYIVGPLLVGFLADEVGYKNVYSIIGIIVIVLASLLIIFTPRKIRLRLQ